MTLQSLLSSGQDLLANTIILLALAYLYTRLLNGRQSRSRRRRTLLKGCMFGISAVIGMLTPVVIMPGVQFDGRSVMLAMAVLYSGWRGGLIAALFVVAARLNIGGAGAINASVLALINVPIMYFLFARGRRPEELTARQFLLIGLILVLEVYFFTAQLGPERAIPALRATVLPLAFVYPLGSVAIGLLLRDALRKTELQEALRESRARFQEITDHIDQAFWIYDAPANRIVYISPNYEQLVGQPTSALYADPAAFSRLLDLKDQRDPAQTWDWMTEDNRQFECRVRRPDGELTWISLLASPLRDVDQRVYRVVGVMTDISQRKQADQQRFELQLELANTSMLRHFINDVSHDFRTPLSAINMSVYFLRRSITDKVLLERVEDVQTQVDRIKQGVENMLTLSQLDQSKKLDIQREKRNLRDLISEVLREEQSALTHKRQGLNVSISSEPLWILIDYHYIRIALMSIMENAIEYTPDEGTITVLVKSRDGKAYVSIEDSGIGIPADDLPHIFERFYRVDKARGVDTGGGGLGLAIAQKVIESHGGHITARSELGKGSCFEISLPLQPVEDTVANAQIGTLAPASSVGKMF